MLTFSVLEGDGIEPQRFPPRTTYLVGSDDVPTAGAVQVQHAPSSAGQFIADQGQASAAGLAVQVVVRRATSSPLTADLGLLTLHTTLLPQRPKPYLLTLELARRQIMLLLNKLEDWGLTDLSADHPVTRQFEKARDQFTDALVAFGNAFQNPEPQTHPAAKQASALAATSLAHALEAGESLALLEADRQLIGRLSGKTYSQAASNYQRVTQETPPANAAITMQGLGHAVLPSVPVLGCSISPTLLPDAVTKNAQSAAMQCCDFVSMPMRWIDLEPKEGKYNFAPTDKWIEWAVRTAKLPVIGGPLIDFRPQSAPEWLFIWENDYETLRDLVFEHVQSIVTRYRRTVARWTVASGLHVNTNFKVSFEQILDLTRIAVLLVKKLHPTAKVQLELTQPWSEYHAANRRSIPPYLYAEAALAAQLPIDAISLRLQMGHAEPGLSTRDLLSLSAMLDRYAALEKPIIISCLGCPSSPVPPTPFSSRVGADAGNPHEPGYWREPWSERAQANWLLHALAICAGKPYVQGICWQELVDNTTPTTDMPQGGLMTAAGTPKPAMQKWAEFRRALREKRNPMSLLERTS
jgi:hypothetical protein